MPRNSRAAPTSFDFDVVSRRLRRVVDAGRRTCGSLFLGSAATRPARATSPASPTPPSTRWSSSIANATTRDELNTACRALDRVLRAGRYWVPMWYSDAHWVAYWDAFSRPERQPKLGTGAPDTWWWDAEKAKKIGL